MTFIAMIILLCAKKTTRKRLFETGTINSSCLTLLDTDMLLLRITFNL